MYEQWGAYSEQRCTLGALGCILEAQGCILRAERCILDTGILAIEGALRSGHAGSSLPCSRLSYIIEQQDPDDEDDDDNDDDAGNVDHNDAGNVDYDLHDIYSEYSECKK